VWAQVLLPGFINGFNGTSEFSCSFNYCEPNKLATWTVGGLSPGESLSQEFSTTVLSNAPSGEWLYLLIEGSATNTDGVVLHNHALIGELVEVQPSELPDLIIENLTVSPNPANPGDEIEIHFDIRNQGDGNATAFQTNVRLNSSGDDVATDDLLLYFCELDGLAAGEISQDCSATVTLPQDLGFGQYYIWVIADVNSEAGQLDESNDKAIVPIEIGESFSGTTVIVHGYNFPPSWLGGNDDGLDIDQNWTLTLAEAIFNRVGGGAIYVVTDGQISVYKGTQNQVGEKIIVFDWLEDSVIGRLGFSESAGDALAAKLVQGRQDGLWELDRLHIIGYSRGTIVASELIQRLEYYSNSITNPGGSSLTIDRDIHFTTLDAHPADGKLGDDVGDLFVDAHDYKVNQGLSDEEEDAVVCWGNVSFHDNYRQAGVSSESPFINNLNGLPSLSFCGDNNTDLSDLNGMDHGAIHAWYHGTVDWSASSDNDGSSPNDIINSWYLNGVDDNRDKMGFNLADAASGNIEILRIDKTGIEATDDISFTLIVNGDFENRGRNELIPGWSLHGGMCSANVINPLVGSNLQLQLNKNNNLCTHNWIYFPTESQSSLLSYKARILNTSDDDQLVVKVGDEIVRTIQASNLGLLFRQELIDVTPYQGQVHTLTFELISTSDDINSGIRIDDVCFNCSGYLNASIASASTSGKRPSITPGIRLHVYDALGNHTGFVNDTTYVEEILGSRLSIYDDSSGVVEQSVYLPEGQTYSFELEAIESASAIDFVIEDASHSGKTVYSIFEDLSLPAGAIAVTSLSTASPDLNLIIDLTGDGAADDTVGVSQHLEEFLITTISTPGGQIAPNDVNYIAYGESLKLTFMPEANFRIADVLVDSISVGAVTSYDFENVIADHSVEVRFESITGTGHEHESPKNEVPVLGSNYPNPFLDRTSIPLRLPAAGSVSLRVYDLLGREVATLIEAHLPAGEHIIPFNAAQLPGGTYLYVLEAGGLTQHRMMTVLR